MPLRDGPRTIYRANNDARDMSDYLLDRGRERHQSPEERANARVPGPDRVLTAGCQPLVR